MTETTEKTLLDRLVGASVRAVLDPGAFTKRGAVEGRPYSESLVDWQRRAVRIALEPIVDELDGTGLPCFSPYDSKERAVPCSADYCGADVGEECTGVGISAGYSHPERTVDGLEARKAGRA